jgi:2-C-methyl-D-erythritol 2,4-cyclodiphosphate synthase
MRVGIGYDVHRFGTEGRLRLGGVEFADLPALAGHSDADPVLHAVADAILGAAGLADIGEQFPDDSAEWKDADSARILGRAALLAARERGLAVHNVDVNIVAERPRLSGMKKGMCAQLAGILSIPIESVSVKARTAEGLGPVGRGQAVEVHAVVLMEDVKQSDFR